MTEMLEYEEHREYDKLVGMLKAAAENLRKASSDFVVIASNTPHVVFDRLERETSIRLISIVESACDFIQRMGYGKPLLAGTLYTMQENFYGRTARKHGFDMVVPSAEDMAQIQNVIFPELEEGLIVPEKKNTFMEIAETYVRNNSVDCVILGCTELPLMIKENDLSVPIVNTSEIHVQKIVDEMLS
jgi:aspartate racemase